MRFTKVFASASVLALISATSAAAQNQRAATVDEVVVTGSFIRGTPEDAALPVDVISSEELQKQGSPTMVEMIKSLTASNGVLGESNQFTSQRGQASEGAGSVNLRGLGPTRTLVLLNGHRLASDDTNALPMSAIGRIEVLKDGAASTYGSDAIGGVVNFITRKNFTGVEVAADYRAIDGSDGDYSASITAGKAWDRFDVMISAGYQFRADLPIVERDWAMREFHENPEATWSTGSSPMSFIPVGANFAPVGARRADIGCTTLGGVITADGLCRSQPLVWDNIVDKMRSAQVYGEFNADLTDTLRFHAEAMYAYTEVPSVNTTPSYTTSRPISQTVLPEGFTNFPTWATPAPDQPPGSNFFYVPISNPGFAAYCAANPAQCPAATAGGVIQLAQWRPFLTGGNPLFDNRESTLYRERRNLRLSASLQGETPKLGFLGQVGWDLNTTYGRYESERRAYDAITGRLQLALRGLGGPACPWQNPANAGNAAAGCFYLNPFSNGIAGHPVLGMQNPGFDPAVENANKELLAWLFTRADEQFTTQEVIETNLVFNGQSDITLPGGQIGWAVGFQWLRTLYNTDPDPLSSNIHNPCPDTPITGSTSCFPTPTSPFVFIGNLNPQDLSRDSYAGFVELNAPITDDLNLVLAARYEDFGDQGGTTFNPKASLRWQALEWLAFRGSVGTTFRAPPLTSLAPDTAVTLQNVLGTFRPVEVTGNPQLEPETAFTYSVGAILNVGNFRATVDYWSFELEKLLTTEPLQSVLDVAFPAGMGSCDVSDPFIAQHFTFNGPCAAENVSSVKLQQINGPETTTSGIDVLATLDIPEVLGGNVQLGGSLSYILDYTVKALVISGVTFSPETDAVGFANFGNSLAFPLPEWKAEAYTEFTRENHNLRWTVRYVDGYIDQRLAQFISTPGNTQVSPAPTVPAEAVTYSGRKIAAFMQHDLAYRVELPWQTTATFTIQNLFDRDPSFARTELNYDALTSSPLGRTFKVGVRKRF